jgi:hypothetical protein
MSDQHQEVRGKGRYLAMIQERNRRTGRHGFADGVEMLKAFADLFESDEEMDEFMAAIRRSRSHD